MKGLVKVFSVIIIAAMAIAAMPVGMAFADAPLATDTVGPIASALTLTPNPVTLGQPVVLTATVDDTTTGGSLISLAEYSLNNGAWTAMTPNDGAFNGVMEAVTATFTPAKAGLNIVCVRGTDVLANVGQPMCGSFSVREYVFKGFMPPIRMNQDNKANAGRTIPVKWQLKTVAGKVVSDKTSFVGLKSYAVDCTILVGDPTTAVMEKAPGKSGLRYLGAGRWIFNWKTPKSYAHTCRYLFVAFKDGTNSPEVLFRFK